MPVTQSKGMENEEQDKPEVEQLDFNNASYSFTPKGVHDWKQRGYYIVCKSCELEHALFIGADKILVGLSEAGPVFKHRHELNMA